MKLTLEIVEEILRVIDESGSREIHLEYDDFVLISRRQEVLAAPAGMAVASAIEDAGPNGGDA